MAAAAGGDEAGLWIDLELSWRPTASEFERR